MTQQQNRAAQESNERRVLKPQSINEGKEMKK